MKTYAVSIDLEVSAENEEQIQEKVEQYLLELIRDESLDITYKEES